MAELSGLQVFKYLPAAKKQAEANCKKCKFPTCMAYALKLAKGQADISLCPHIPDELREILEQSLKKPQKEVFLGHKNKVLTGGENVLYRHDKTFVNKTIISVLIDTSTSDWKEKLDRVLDFKLTRIEDVFKVDLICFRGEVSEDILEDVEQKGFAWVKEEELSELCEVKDGSLKETVDELIEIRKKAVIEKDENFSNPVLIKLDYDEDIYRLMSKASVYLCKYANVLMFENFNEALFSTLMTLRQNIYTDPQKPLQVESKLYEFNNPDENSLVFLTTNFALTYFAVANELEALNRSAYLVITPSDGMSVLTAWSAEKFTAQIVAKTVRKFNLAEKVKTKKIIIPGLLEHIKDEIQEELPEFEIVVGTVEAYQTANFVKSLNW